MSLKHIEFDQLATQRRLDAERLFTLAGSAQAVMCRLDFPVDTLQDRNFENISGFYANLVGKLDALPSLLPIGLRFELEP